MAISLIGRNKSRENDRRRCTCHDERNILAYFGINFHGVQIVHMIITTWKKVNRAIATHIVS